MHGTPWYTVFLADGTYGEETVRVPADPEGRPPHRISVNDLSISRGRVEEGAAGNMPASVDYGVQQYDSAMRMYVYVVVRES